MARLRAFDSNEEVPDKPSAPWAREAVFVVKAESAREREPSRVNSFLSVRVECSEASTVPDPINLEVARSLSFRDTVEASIAIRLSLVATED